LRQTVPERELVRRSQKPSFADDRKAAHGFAKERAAEFGAADYHAGVAATLDRLSPKCGQVVIAALGENHHDTYSTLICCMPFVCFVPSCGVKMINWTASTGGAGQSFLVSFRS
jgi:hypothetical protein